MVKRKHAFEKVSIKERGDVIEIRERRAREIVYALVLLMLPFCCIPWGAASGVHQTADPLALVVVITIFTLVPVIGLVIFCRPPRVISLNPRDKTVYTARWVFVFDLFSRQYEFDEGPLGVEKTRILTGYDSKTTTAAGRILLFFMGPIGFLLSLHDDEINGRGSQMAYVLTAPFQGKPIAIFIDHSDPKQLAALYNAQLR
ncbi:MAG: hypothetical protein AAF085_05010 [Planctomycetota bacterium]